jgi:hypothetical protein
MSDRVSFVVAQTWSSFILTLIKPVRISSSWAVASTASFFRAVQKLYAVNKNPQTAIKNVTVIFTSIFRPFVVLCVYVFASSHARVADRQRIGTSSIVQTAPVFALITPFLIFKP